MLLEGARRVGKSTIAENFEKNEYKSYILIDFSKAANRIRDCFDDIGKLLSEKLPANMGYLYENLVAQMIAASGRELYYYTWEKADSTHYYEVDFLTSEESKINAFEIKSSGTGKHESIRQFQKKFSKHVKNVYLLSQKDVGNEENLLLKPFYVLPFLV